MEAQYRVYYHSHNDDLHPTFFMKDLDGWYCTHGGWTGTDIGDNKLSHAYGIAEYTRHKDMTKQEYDKLFDEYMGQ